MKTILKIILAVILLTPGSFVIPAALIVTIAHHLAHNKTENAEQSVKTIEDTHNETHWSYIMRKKLKLPNHKNLQKTDLLKSKEVPSNNRLLAKLKFKKNHQPILK